MTHWGFLMLWDLWSLPSTVGNNSVPTDLSGWAKPSGERIGEGEESSRRSLTISPKIPSVPNWPSVQCGMRMIAVDLSHPSEMQPVSRSEIPMVMTFASDNAPETNRSGTIPSSIQVPDVARRIICVSTSRMLCASTDVSTSMFGCE